MTSSDLRVISLSRLAAQGRWRVEAMRSLAEPCIVLFTKGMGRITMAGVTRGYAAGTVAYIPAGVMHGFEVGPQVLGQALFLGRAAPDELPPDLPTGPQVLRLRDATLQQEIVQMFDLFAREKALGTAAGARAARLHLGLLAVWLGRQFEQQQTATQRPDAAHRLVARFAEAIEQRFRTGAGVADFAAELGVTPTHLTRCCRAASGRSAIELLQDRRLFEARKLLSDTKLPVGEISAALGFTSAAYFTRAFQNQIGLSPSAFRKCA